MTAPEIQEPSGSGAHFAHDWLALREPVDHRSRASELLAPLRVAWTDRTWVRILDLGSGTGSNLRYFCSRLPGPQEWTLIDHDATLLSHAEPCGEAGLVVRRQGDLANEGLAAVAEAHLVAASALLDLVSDAWLVHLVEGCRRSACGACFALNYDGRITWGGSAGDHQDDEFVLDAVNAHQRRDKGLGPALGPDAGARAEELFAEAGYRTWLLPSPWRLGSADAGLARSLIAGWEEAAVEQARTEERRIRRWAEQRQVALEADDFELTVGHVDLLALPGE